MHFHGRHLCGLVQVAASHAVQRWHRCRQGLVEQLAQLCGPGAGQVPAAKPLSRQRGRLARAGGGAARRHLDDRAVGHRGRAHLAGLERQGTASVARAVRHSVARGAAAGGRRHAGQRLGYASARRGSLPERRCGVQFRLHRPYPARPLQPGGVAPALPDASCAHGRRRRQSVGRRHQARAHRAERAVSRAGAALPGGLRFCMCPPRMAGSCAKSRCWMYFTAPATRVPCWSAASAFIPGLADPDPLHTNQVQVLSAAMAPAFPHVRGRRHPGVDAQPEPAGRHRWAHGKGEMDQDRAVDQATRAPVPGQRQDRGVRQSTGSQCRAVVEAQAAPGQPHYHHRSAEQAGRGAL